MNHEQLLAQANALLVTVKCEADRVQLEKAISAVETALQVADTCEVIFATSVLQAAIQDAEANNERKN